jgi:hypothetical protein
MGTLCSAKESAKFLKKELPPGEFPKICLASNLIIFCELGARAETYDHPFWEKSNQGRDKRERRHSVPRAMPMTQTNLIWLK